MNHLDANAINDFMRLCAKARVYRGRIMIPTDLEHYWNLHQKADRANKKLMRETKPDYSGSDHTHS